TRSPTPRGRRLQGTGLPCTSSAAAIYTTLPLDHAMGPSMPMKRGRYIVTGAGGLIGFELVRQLLIANEMVLAVDVFKKGGRSDLEQLAKKHAGALEIVETDLASDPNALASISSVWGAPVDAIFHFAAIVGVSYVTDHPYETLSVNIRSTLNMLDYA